MNDVRDILQQLHGEEVSISRALEMLNEKADKAQRTAFDAGWRARMLNRSSNLERAWINWKSGDGFVG